VLLLLPVKLSVKNDSNYPVGWIPSGTLYTPTFRISATVKSIPGLNLTANLLQDIQTNRSIKYDDGSSSQCQDPNYMADDSPGRTLGVSP
jgi:hypothetical protein